MSPSSASVTVIIPCLNAEKTLPAALSSVLHQTIAPLEVLVVDDGSTDRSVAVAAAFDPRVRVLRNPSRGPGAAREFGVREARGEFIAFVDADDTVNKTKHEKQLTVLEQSDPCTLVHTDSILNWADGSKTSYQRRGAERAIGHCTQLIFERNPVCGASTMMRRSVILELGNYDSDLFGTEDFGMSLVASTRCRFVHIPEPLYVVERHSNNITRRRSHMAYFHWLAQERFRQRCPDAFDQLPAETVRQYMVEPVTRAVKEAYWHRNPHDYARLLRLAVSLDPYDTELRHMWKRRRIPFAVLRALDLLTGWLNRSPAEAS